MRTSRLGMIKYINVHSHLNKNALTAYTTRARLTYLLKCQFKLNYYFTIGGIGLVDSEDPAKAAASANTATHPAIIRYLEVAFG